MQSKFTNEEKQAILDRYILKSESPTSIIKSVGISKSTFYKWLSDYRAEQVEAKRKGLIPFARSATSLMRSITSFAEGNFI